ncbi:MAG: ABC transporter ATP-binding protein [Acidimicrobiia bacterium]|jgi:ABC-2 type transport system ATP-binding protein|nr:ABC transporter ATP-binding protein [Acidimicrobiia bacterium]
MLLAVHDLRHTYGDEVALAGVDLSVDAGEFVALLGPNGAGKTTLVRSVIGLIQPTSGSVRVAGGSPARAEVRRRLGVVQQDVGFPSTLTVREIVEGAAARAGAGKDRAKAAMTEMGLADLARRRASNLSGGQQQRLQLAMGLVADPALLVLDEPTVGLDAASRKAFWATLEERRNRGTGILLTTHIVEEAAALADRIVVLHKGRVVAEGTPSELQRTLPGRRVTARTSVPAEVLRAVDGVVSVTASDGEVDIAATIAEPVVRTMLELDPTTSDLVVATAPLDDVLIALTNETKEMVA